MTAAHQSSPWRRERDDLLHGVAGAFLFGAPFLYTMEVWWKGNFTSPPRLLAALALTYAALVGLNAATGFRAAQPRTLSRTLADSAEALALGLLLAAVSLACLRRITPDDGLAAILGRVILEAVPFALGVGIANGLLRARENASPGDAAADGTQDGSDPARGAVPGTDGPRWRGTLADLGATMLGATIIAFSIAPTDEIPLIAGSLSGPWLLGVVGASLALSYVIVFAANFAGSERRAARRTHGAPFQRPLSETLIAYLLALVMAAVMLWLFQLVRPGDPPRQWVSYIIVLGLPATIGGAAGRLAV